MRELLFRGKRLLNGEWVHGHSIRNTLMTSDKLDKFGRKSMLPKSVAIREDAEENSFYWTLVDSNTVGQWTGLLDSKRNKIFEGDIVKRIIAKENGLIVWDDKRCGFYIKPLSRIGKAMYDPYYKMNANKLEIVGNIYDNPELLEEK